MHNVVNTARFLKYFWAFYNIRHKRVKLSVVYEFEISFPKCITLHFDALNFNSYFLDHLMNRLILSWSLLCEVVEISFCINFVLSANKNNKAITSFGKSLIM